MDLLGEEPAFVINDRDWRIYSRNTAEPPHFIGENADIKNSLITEGCEIYGVVENSVLSGGVVVEPGAFVKDSVIMNGTRIGAGSVVNYSIIDGDVVVGKNCSIGRPKDVADGITLVGAAINLDEGTVVPAGAMISASEK